MRRTRPSTGSEAVSQPTDAQRMRGGGRRIMIIIKNFTSRRTRCLDLDGAVYVRARFIRIAFRLIRRPFAAGVRRATQVGTTTFPGRNHVAARVNNTKTARSSSAQVHGPDGEMPTGYTRTSTLTCIYTARSIPAR